MICNGSRRRGTPAVIRGFYHCPWCGRAFRRRRAEDVLPTHIAPAMKKMLWSLRPKRKS